MILILEKKWRRVAVVQIAVVGDRGLVGRELLKLFPPQYKVRTFGREEKPNFAGAKLTFLCTDAHSAKDLAREALQAGSYVIDLSSAHRKEAQIPLVIPEINGHLLQQGPRLIASPNCTASIMVMALAPLHRAYTIKRIVASTYQAASGAGYKGLEELLENKPPSVFPHPFQYNLFLHESPLEENGYSGEENKVIFETKKILNAPEIEIGVRCVRVPILRAHSIALNVTFEKSPVDPQALLAKAPGIAFHPSPTPQIAEGKHEVYYGPIRRDLSHQHSLDLWVVGDQLLKGAALNAFQIGVQLLSYLR